MRTEGWSIYQGRSDGGNVADRDLHRNCDRAFGLSGYIFTGPAMSLSARSTGGRTPRVAKPDLGSNAGQCTLQLKRNRSVKVQIEPTGGHVIHLPRDECSSIAHELESIVR